MTPVDIPPINPDLIESLLNLNVTATPLSTQHYDETPILSDRQRRRMEEREHWEKLRLVREATGVQQPELHEFPRWFRPLVTAAIKDGRLPKPDHAFSHPYYALIHAARHCGGDNWIDHAGRLRLPDRSFVLCSEPYMLTTESFSQLEMFCTVLRLQYRVEPKSWWYPPKTIRITVWEDSPNA